ncbi:alpha/beta hydrolase [Rhodobacteraceae bacterium]|nr:alpha/beta hydrolase [Paracoccaceae bacterium]
MKVDVFEDGHGSAVLLIHSTVAGNKQWRKLVEYLSPNYRVLAPNLFGYGTTPEWSKNRHQTLIDQVDLLADFFEQNESISIVGHSFGGSVAMMAAKKYPAKIKKLILIEPNPFYLLKHHSDHDSYQEALNLRDIIKTNAYKETWGQAAEKFADYWNGSGTWKQMDGLRREKFAEALKPNFHEFDCVINETTSLEEWRDILPQNTHILFSKQTVNSIRKIVTIFEETMPNWIFHSYSEGTHMAPLTHPNIVNPIIHKILTEI